MISEGHRQLLEDIEEQLESNAKESTERAIEELYHELQRSSSKRDIARERFYLNQEQIDAMFGMERGRLQSSMYD